MVQQSYIPQQIAYVPSVPYYNPQIVTSAQGYQQFMQPGLPQQIMVRNMSDIPTSYMQAPQPQIQYQHIPAGYYAQGQPPQHLQQHQPPPLPYNPQTNGIRRYGPN